MSVFQICRALSASALPVRFSLAGVDALRASTKHDANIVIGGGWLCRRRVPCRARNNLGAISISHHSSQTLARLTALASPRCVLDNSAISSCHTSCLAL